MALFADFALLLEMICPICRSSIANSDHAKELSQTIDSAILVLLLPTLAIICGLIGLVYKYRQPEGDEPQSDSSRSINSYVDFRSSDTECDPE